MFEKELEEYKNQSKWKGKIFMKDEEICFKDGAELGYNKANEWHYVKNGDLPRQYEHTCFSIDVLANNKKWVYYEFSSGKWFCGNKEVNVYAWREIELPKEIKEND